MQLLTKSQRKVRRARRDLDAIHDDPVGLDVTAELIGNQLQIRLDEASYLDHESFGIPGSTPDSDLDEYDEPRGPNGRWVAAALVVLVVAGAVCLATQL